MIKQQGNCSNAAAILKVNLTSGPASPQKPSAYLLRSTAIEQSVRMRLLNMPIRHRLGRLLKLSACFVRSIQATFQLDADFIHHLLRFRIVFANFRQPGSHQLVRLVSL